MVREITFQTDLLEELLYKEHPLASLQYLIRMKESEIIKYSQQIVLYKSPQDYLIANGFFVEYEHFPYFITVNHAIEPQIHYEGDVHLILHANGKELNTRTIKLDKWQFIDLYAFPKTDNKVDKFSLPYFDIREDFAFCQVQKTIQDPAISTLPYHIQDAAPATCHNKHLDFIRLPEQLAKPTKDKYYHIAGKILQQRARDILWKYNTYFYTNMKYIGDFEGLYQFQSYQSATLEDWKGLSGSPVFDDELKLVGVAVRYNEEDNILLVFPAEDIAWYLRNDIVFPQLRIITPLCD